MKAIEITNLTKKYKDIVAVDNLNLEIEENKLFALLGVNGDGKSTTIKMLSTLISPTSGDAFILGKSIVSQASDVKNIINVSPQETAVAMNLTVYENIKFIGEIYNIDNDYVLEIISKLGLEEVKNKYAKKLSGGYQRRLSIAMALVSKPKVLFLDEPTLGLDVIARSELWQFIKLIKSEMTIILTTHYLEEVEELADEVGIMAKGKLKIKGTIDEIIASKNYNNFEQAFIDIASK